MENKWIPLLQFQVQFTFSLQISFEEAEDLNPCSSDIGSAASVDKKNPDLDSAMKFRFCTGSSNKPKNKLLIPQSPINGKPPNNENSISQFGSKEETFFDSQAWLESDCDDDFLSVNGEFTPSGSISSNHNISFTESPRVSQSHFMDRVKGGTSPGDKKKKLAELLRESLGGDEDYYIGHNNKKQEAKPSSLSVLPKSTNGSPCMSQSNSTRSSEKTPSRYYKSEKEKSGKNSQCCLPSLVTSLSFKEKKKKLSPSRDGEV